MPATWPTELPRRMSANGSSFEMGDGRLRSTTDTGPGKSRRRSSAVVDSFTAVYVMSAAQLDILEAFVRTELVGGSLPFILPSPRGVDWLVMFSDGGLPATDPLGNNLWRVTMGLERLP